MGGIVTKDAGKAMTSANQEAIDLRHGIIQTEHLLLALLKLESGAATDVLQNFGIDPGKLRADVLELVPAGLGPVALKRLPQDPRAKKAVEHAAEESFGLDCSLVGTEHLLLGLIRETGGIAGQVLRKHGLTPERVREEIIALQGGAPTPPPVT
jgi:ATP-dependent Clp protease ATP-binding subunit ClpC